VGLGFYYNKNYKSQTQLTRYVIFFKFNHFDNYTTIGEKKSIKGGNTFETKGEI